MGKKVRKKARSSHKEERFSTSSPKAVPEETNLSADTVADGDLVEKERRVCVHLEKAVDLVKVSSKIQSAVSTGCEDCGEGAIDRSAGKGKGKHSRKKGASDSKGETKATWVCLQCGHFSCGGIGLPTSPQSHTVRHARQSRHPLVIQVENPHLRWCFSCNTLIPVDKLEDTVEQKDVLLDFVKLVKEQSSKGNSVDVEDIWFGSGSGSVVSELKSENKDVDVVTGKDFYAVRGLVNLGNTCFFNSVLQNLLAMHVLREYLVKYDGSMGPLTSSLKKIFVETSPGTGLRNVVNPKPLFGCVCAKAPQFRGYQQQDSHELLRYLLDGLSTEELCAKRSDQSTSSDNRESQPVSPTFVDAIFGGQLSSTVCCVECGHSSVVYEPFLDLSLPVPTKKPPKKALPGSRMRKTKLPPKRGGRTRPKLNKDGDSTPILSGCNPSSSNESSALTGAISCSSSVNLVEVGNLAVTGNVGLSHNSSNSTEREYSSTQASQCGEPMGEQEADCLAWLDYLEPVPLLDDPNLAAESEGLPVSQYSCSKEGDWHALDDTTRSAAEANAHHGDAKSNTESTVDDLGSECPAQVQHNEILLLTYKEDSATTTEGINIHAEVSPSAIDEGEDALGFDGLGDLFNEPEVNVTTSSVTNDFQASEHLGNGPAGNSSESDANEVDDTDSPVSIESCLAHFIKPELLSGQHAWHCENCSKLLHEKRQKVRKNQFKTSSVIQNDMSNYECSSSEVLRVRSHLSPDCCSTVLARQNNGNSGLDENLKKIDATQINGLCQTSVQEREECSNQHENLKNGSSDLDENLKKLDAKQMNGLCLTLIQEEGGFSGQENMHLHAWGGSSFVGSSDDCTLDGKSVNLHSASSNHVPVETVPELDKEEESESEEEVDSKNVKVMRDATKRILINKAPPILTIHLKRFGQDARGHLSKLNGYVGFKECINLGPYLDSRPTERDNYIYRLAGVVEHSGSMRRGHYIAYVRGGDRCRARFEEENRRGNTVWYYASDAYIHETTLEEVLRCEAYLLFYEKIKP